MDASDAQHCAMLEPLHNVLDRSWLVPMHLAFGMDAVAQSFRNMSLSFRGSERQAPSLLQMSLRFSKIMELQALSGTAPSGNTEARLHQAILEFNCSAGLNHKHALDSEKERSVLNLIVGTSKECRDLMAMHLHWFKWKDSALSADQLRSQRWLIGARPKGVNDGLRGPLTMTAESQVMLMDLHIKSFVAAGKRLKASARARVRLSQEQFDQMADFAAMFGALRVAAKQASSKPEVDDKLMQAFYAKDYWQEIEAVVNSKSATFSIQGLSVWRDIVETGPEPAALTVEGTLDLAAAEEAVAATKFAEIRAKISADVQSMNQYNAEKSNCANKTHVLKVLHEKNQQEQGKQHVDAHMQNNAFTALSSDLNLPANFDQFLKGTAAKLKLCLVGYLDTTKFGVLSQSDINKVGQWCEKVMAKNPTGSCVVLTLPLLTSTSSAGALRADVRRIEDKLISKNIEMRPFVLATDNSECHANRDSPAAYIMYLCICDSTLPMKGTAHRVSRSAEQVDKNNVNVFCTSKLWSLQAVQGEPPKAIPEAQFVVPGGVAFSNEARKNYTDLQETAQWLGGVHIPRSILSTLLGENRTALVVHGSLYDGCVEKVCLDMGLSSFSHTDDAKAFGTGTMLLKTHLMSLWKSRVAPMDRYLPRYKAEPESDALPSAPEQPKLKVCVFLDNCLSLPRDIRGLFLADPIRGPEWRKILQEFDRIFGSGVAPPGPADQAAGPGPASSAAPQAPFAGETFSEENVTTKFTFSPQLMMYVVNGEKLFIEATEEVSLAANTMLLAYGAGSWLQDQRARSFLEENGGAKGVECAFKSDQVKVVLEDGLGQCCKSMSCLFFWFQS
ncbi:unnamed protein product [Effrenium voratum]|nr:unnamed protein product [Effrenium voratum]